MLVAPISLVLPHFSKMTGSAICINETDCQISYWEKRRIAVSWSKYRLLKCQATLSKGGLLNDESYRLIDLFRFIAQMQITQL